MAINTPNAAAAWRPDEYAFAPADAVPEALINQLSTVAGTVEGDAPVVRVAYVDDASATSVPEGAVIEESDPTLAELLIPTRKIALLTQLSNEMFSQDRTPDMISTSVARAIVRKSNEDFLTAPAPTAGESGPTGILNTAGITTGTAVTDNLDPITDLLAALEELDGIPTAIVLGPDSWAYLSKIKAGTGSAQPLLGSGVEAGERRLFGLPVVVTNAMTPNTGLIVDTTAVLSSVGQVKVASSDHAAFTSDSVVLRSTWRTGWGVVHPERLGTFTVGTAA
ncbi:phage major capsid protein [Brevibacterium samyangense]|uniref:Phage capsid-like C-terminal domain-containing protein n=1 Tax=Brevibacterium samyangense TaxID=366888 RepID=A0ABP5F6F0_9MICO